MRRMERKTVKILRTVRRRATKLNIWKNGNKGMSLVEVIIAITILSIVVVPVMQSLTTSMYYNAKARKRQNLTVTAESIMETFKGYSLTKLQGMFKASGGISGVYNVSEGTATTYSVAEYPVDTTVTSEDGTSKVIKAGSYVFDINNFATESGKTDTTYNAKITITPNDTQNLYEAVNVQTINSAVYSGKRSYDTGLIKGESKLYNHYLNNGADGLYAVFSKIDNEHAGITDDDKNWKYLGLKIYTSDSSAGTEINSVDVLKVDDIKNYISIKDRTTTFDVNGNKVTVKMEYHYYISNLPYYVVKQKKPKKTDSSSSVLGDIDTDAIYVGETNKVEVPETIDRYPSGETDYLTYEVPVDNKVFYDESANIDRLYIYYYPQYDTSVTDNIVINNNGGTNFDVFLLKQMAPDLSDSAIEIGEGGYKPDVKLNNSSGATVNLYHNLDENIADPKKSVGTASIDSLFKTASNFTKATSFNKDEQLSYRINVEITDSDGKVLSSLDSSMNEKIGNSLSESSASGETSEAGEKSDEESDEKEDEKEDGETE